MVGAGLVKRIRAMTLKLLPVEVPLESISDPTSRIITPQVINAYMAAAGDFMEAVRNKSRLLQPYLLLPTCTLEAAILPPPRPQRVHVGSQPLSRRL